MPLLCCIPEPLPLHKRRLNLIFWQFWSQQMVINLSLQWHYCNHLIPCGHPRIYASASFSLPLTGHARRLQVMVAAKQVRTKWRRETSRAAATITGQHIQVQRNQSRSIWTPHILVPIKTVHTLERLSNIYRQVFHSQLTHWGRQYHRCSFDSRSAKTHNKKPNRTRNRTNPSQKKKAELGKKEYDS